MKYFDELKRSMEWIGSKENTIFIGQAVEVPGTAMFNTLKDIDKSKRVELPVFEDTQLGMSIGMSLAGKKVISIFPRWNFLLCATNQLVSHLDKLPIISEGEVTPNILIRTAVGSVRPLDPQSQHRGDFSKAFKQMCKNIDIYKITKANEVFKTYKKVLNNKKRISLVVEIADFYNEK